MKLLITAGATREPIDAVRFISNVSSGRTGAELAGEFSRRGFEVTLLHGEAAAQPQSRIATEVFSSAADLRARLGHRLGREDFDAVIMAAAVADFRSAEVSGRKISSDAPDLTLRLVRNEKILPQLRSFARRPLRVIGFKLTVDADDSARQSAVGAQFAAGGVDAVVHNDLAEIRAAKVHPFWLWQSATEKPVRLDGVPALAAALAELLAGSRT
jgi:phosphopantothenoylcysteine synthetase/decarboxylase